MFIVLRYIYERAAKPRPSFDDLKCKTSSGFVCCVKLSITATQGSWGIAFSNVTRDPTDVSQKSAEKTGFDTVFTYTDGRYKQNANVCH